MPSFACIPNCRLPRGYAVRPRPSQVTHAAAKRRLHSLESEHAAPHRCLHTLSPPARLATPELPKPSGCSTDDGSCDFSVSLPAPPSSARRLWPAARASPTPAGDAAASSARARSSWVNSSSSGGTDALLIAGAVAGGRKARVLQSSKARFLEGHLTWHAPTAHAPPPRVQAWRPGTDALQPTKAEHGAAHLCRCLAPQSQLADSWQLPTNPHASPCH